MKKNQKMKKNQIAIRKGFTLIETFISVAIFALAATMFLGSFSSFLKNSVAAKKAQRNAESAQYAMNLMAKTIRTSTLNPAFSNTSAIQLKMYDNSQGSCVFYIYGSGVLALRTAAGNNIADCMAGATTYSAPLPLTAAGEISAVTFSGTNTSGSTLGKVTIVADITSANTLIPNYKMQTSVSLRQ